MLYIVKNSVVVSDGVSQITYGPNSIVENFSDEDANIFLAHGVIREPSEIERKAHLADKLFAEQLAAQEAAAPAAPKKAAAAPKKSDDIDPLG